MQNLIKAVIQEWEIAEQFTMPDLLACVAFLTTEAAEALDEVLRLDTTFVRNNPRDGSLNAVKKEIADTFFMAYIACNLLGVSADQIIKDKLKEMDLKRFSVASDILSIRQLESADLTKLLTANQREIRRLNEKLDKK